MLGFFFKVIRTFISMLVLAEDVRLTTMASENRDLAVDDTCNNMASHD